MWLWIWLWLWVMMVKLKICLGVYNWALTNYVYDDGELYATDTCITKGSMVIAYECTSLYTITKHYWLTSDDTDCYYGYSSDESIDYNNNNSSSSSSSSSSNELEFVCNYTNHHAIYYYNYSYDPDSISYSCPINYDSLSPSLVTTVTDVCIPGKMGYYEWTCDHGNLTRHWFSDLHCLNETGVIESLNCNVTSIECDYNNTYAYLGYNKGDDYYYYYYYWDPDVPITAGAVVAIIISVLVALCAAMGLCCWWCTAHKRPSQSYGSQRPTIVALTTQSPVMAPYVITTQPQYYAHQQYIQQQQPQPQPQSQLQTSTVFTSQPVPNYIASSQLIVNDYKIPSVISPYNTANHINYDSNSVVTNTFDEAGPDIEGIKNPTS